MVPGRRRSGRAPGGCGEQRASREDRGVRSVTAENTPGQCLACVHVCVFKRERRRGLGFWRSRAHSCLVLVEFCPLTHLDGRILVTEAPAGLGVGGCFEPT